MNLTTTEKYALVAFESNGKLSDIQKHERGICLVASCLWDMIKAEVIAPDTNGKMNITTPLPEELVYCKSVYEFLAKKPRKSEDVVLEYTYTFSDKRIKVLVENLVNDLAEKSALVVEKSRNLRNQKYVYVDKTLLADDIDAVKSMGESITSNQYMLAILLLKSGVAKRLLSKEELSNLKKSVKRDNRDFQPYIKNMIAAIETTISSAAVTSTILTQ